MRWKKLPDKERLKRHKTDKARRSQRLQAAIHYLNENHPKKIMCKNCNILHNQIAGKITESTVRLFCKKCKNIRIIKVSLPKRFIPIVRTKKNVALRKSITLENFWIRCKKCRRLDWS